jgi:hypothetical protein
MDQPVISPTSAKLDDVMIAMDVVDTVRHREDLVRRELNDTGREAELIGRLKEIYHQQGIEVPDSVLMEGVKALKESRFSYAPPPSGWKRLLLTAWVKRDAYKIPLAVIIGLGIALWTYNYVNVVRPAQQAESAAQIELSETLPKAIRQAHADIAVATGDPPAKARADALLADGERAIRDKDRLSMQRAAGDLKALREDVLREYVLTIVSRPGETSGVWRRPKDNPQGRNYYLVVEAIAPNGQKLTLPVRNEENALVETVEKFGVRVPQATFDAVAADKRDDGIVQRNRFGTKKRGMLAPDYQMPFEGGMITKW